uniref:C-type lectin domain-containing protein n=1 Tax=Stegastes partitus TaxID=144197 RepID=A0A3B4ZIC3_9TELE
MDTETETLARFNWKNTMDLSQALLTTNAFWTGDGWFPEMGYTGRNFFCISLKIVEEKKAWEQAVAHCRDSYTDLTSLLSDAETKLAQNEMERHDITEPMWIGLRFLGDRWLWVNGDTLVDTAWSQGEGQVCPMVKRCGALTTEGLWEERDCQEKLKFILNSTFQFQPQIPKLQ